MMAYLLDTCIVSLFFRKEPRVIEALETKTPDQIKISTITVMEIEYGLQLNPSLQQRIRPIWQDFKDQTEVLLFSESDAVCAAQIRSLLKKEGKPIGPYDILLAGIAKNRNLVFVTDNMSEFTRVDGLAIENWAKTH
jgi:tRNA(fMet)-specific endonuclease VapC